MNWQGWVGVGLAAVFALQVVERLVGQMKRLAEERRESLEAQIDRMVAFAGEVLAWIQHQPHDPDLVRRLEESLRQLRAYRDPELRFQEAAFLEVLLERLMEQVAQRAEGDGEVLLWVERWKGLLRLLNEMEVRYQEAVEAYHARLSIPGVNLVAGLMGYSRMPEFSLAGAVEASFARAMERAEEGHGDPDRQLL